MITIILIILIALSLTILFLALLASIELETKPKQKPKIPTRPPLISVILPARNEESNILRALRSLEKLNYPIDSLEILVGDDGSTDKTAQLVKQFIKNKPQFHLIEINERVGKAKYKANALAVLISKSHGEFLFFLDADIEIHPDWVITLLQEFTPQIGIVTGTTLIKKATSYIDKGQAIVWLYLGAMLSFMNSALPVSGYGNDMAIRKKAYAQTSGFESLENSFTEDYEITQQLAAKGWKIKQLLSQAALNQTLALPKITDVYHQHKRWLSGGMTFRKPLIIALPIMIGMAAFVVLLFFEPLLVLWFAIIKFVLQTILLYVVNKKTDSPLSFFDLIAFEPYYYWIIFVASLFFFLPKKAVWHGREIS